MTRFLICPGRGPAAKAESATLPESRTAASKRPTILQVAEEPGNGTTRSASSLPRWAVYIYAANTAILRRCVTYHLTAPRMPAEAQNEAGIDW